MFEDILIAIFIGACISAVIVDENGASPLLTAVRCNHLEVGQLLIEANCDLNKIGEVTIGDSHILITPFRCAVMLKYWQFAELLVYAGK